MRSTQYEREFCEYSEKEGFHAERVAGSGRREKSVCDIVLVKDGQGYLVEVKSTKDKTYYVSNIPNTRARLNELIKVSKKSGAIPLLAVRFKHRGRKKVWVVKLLSSNLSKITRDGKSLY